MKNKRLFGYTFLVLALLALAFVSYKFGWISAGGAILAAVLWASVVITWAIVHEWQEKEETWK